MMENAIPGTFSSSPYYGRLPSFAGSKFAFHRLTAIDAFETATSIYVDMHRREFPLRKLLLNLGKTIAMSETEKVDAFLNVISKADLPYHYTTDDAAGREGFLNLGRRVSVKTPFKIDFVVLPSIAADPETGNRIGLGLGHEGGLSPDLTCGILAEIGALKPTTKFITFVHPRQLISFHGSMESYDVPVDFIFTPGKTYPTYPNEKPCLGIHWDLLRNIHFEEVACLVTLRSGTSERRSGFG